ncbi:hypothetical protein AAG747_00140 [Rapidithrix thailandica]|uniref:HTTM-like domain-containing protein n=1 Tax=Rapidithrix thailandica TaxID=413964 RepID=A0AAW9RXV3_9BACT
MDRLNAFLDNLSKQNNFSYYLSIFRIFIGFHIIKKIYLLWGSQSILLSNGVFFEHKDIFLDYLGIDSTLVLDYNTLFLSTIVVTSILIIFGVGKNFTLIALYLEMKILQDLTYPILNGGDNLLIFVLLYLIFSKCFDHFTLVKSEVKHGKLSLFVSNLAVYSICIHLGYVYFISAIHKIHSDVWFNGTALYYIMNLERFESPLNHYVSDSGFFTTMGTYFTLLFEMLFIFLVWNKHLKIVFLLSGILLHAGIYFFMMIYDFEIFFVSLYGFFISNLYWEKIVRYLDNQVMKIKSIYLKKSVTMKVGATEVLKK